MFCMDKKRKRKIFAIYDKNDNYCFSGNVIECAEYLEISKDTVYSMISKTKNGTSKYRHKIYQLEDD